MFIMYGERQVPYCLHILGQLEKIFFCFPDPHFKAKNFRRRIISSILLSEYAYFLAPNARLYAITGDRNTSFSMISVD
jgi:tRNA G46 methylase TrmB